MKRSRYLAEQPCGRRFAELDYLELYQELKRKGVTLQLLRAEYAASAEHEQVDATFAQERQWRYPLLARSTAGRQSVPIVDPVVTRAPPAGRPATF